MDQTKKQVTFPDHKLIIAVDPGDNLLGIIQRAGLSINADCGGVRQCGKCLVEVNGHRKLACTCHVVEDAEVVICNTSSDEDYDILLDSSLITDAPAVTQSSTKLGIALDIGTTTVVGKLLELGSGNALASFALLNAQMSYGADVISRINCCLDDASELSALITAQIDGAIATMLADAGIAGSRVERVVIAGNTTMTYILLNLPCRSLGFAPFVPAYTYERTHSYEAIFHTKTLDATCLILPFISAYIGGDLSAGLCALSAEDDFILMDMGTNGELIFKRGAAMICTASAAGPAFEGGCIECGSGSMRGAISKVTHTSDGFDLHTIGAAPPESICGSGLLDLIAELVREGTIDKSGLLDLTIETRRVFLAQEVYLSQMDIRQFQLAKSAVRTGLEILMVEMGHLQPSKIFLAGGFGQNLDAHSAGAVDLLPASLVERTYSIGNSSLLGAVKVCLNPALLDSIEQLALDATEINLAKHPLFDDQFLANMAF
ncbi:MAG: ASKHA domain-containing protein [Coriobacteriales bacterium]|nr:ASKHA domain-containing protein [Coriobacteriales bacterium]